MQAFTIFADRSAFETQLGRIVIDDYSDPGYDLNGPAEFDVFINAAMSAVLGETDYTTTGGLNLIDFNVVEFQSTNPKYCAGCNGSFLLSFTTTSIGDASGVFGAGFEFFNLGGDFPPTFYTAFVTFGDGTTTDVGLGFAPLVEDLTNFFGITAEQNISSIHVSLSGAPLQTCCVGIDNLTIGSRVAIPEPATLALLAIGITALSLMPRHN